MGFIARASLPAAATLLALPITTPAQDNYLNFLGVPSESFSGPISTERPSFSTGPLPLASGHLQAEGGIQFTSADDGFDSGTFPQALLRAGVARNLELQIGWAGYSFTDTGSEDIEGGNDITLALKTQVLQQQGSVPTVGVLGQVSLPVGDDDIGTDSVDPTAGVLWSYGLDSVGFFGNVLFTSPTAADDDRFFETDISLGAGTSLTDRLGAYVEYFGLFPTEGDDAHNIDGGLQYLLSRNFAVDAVLGLGLNDAANDAFIGAGVGYRW